MTKSQQYMLTRILPAAVLLAALLVMEYTGMWERIGQPLLEVLCYVAVYALIGWDIVLKAIRNLCRGQVFDENFLMTVATVAAFCLREYPEAVAVMLFYQVGEWFQGYAVGRSRQSIAALMDICPEYAVVERDGVPTEVDPDEVAVGTIILIRPGERVPLDGRVVEGESLLDTSALTGESMPQSVGVGSEIVSGCINGSGTLKVETTRLFEDSTVTRILELVENAASKKAPTERFITRFARIYTPAVTLAAVLLAAVPPLLFGGDFGDWAWRACTFLVISCPCALVISIPLGFFGGIGAASKIGVLIKGSHYLESLSAITTLVLDKTGTLTKGEFRVSAVQPVGISAEQLLEIAALGEGLSSHPIAAAIRDAYGKIVSMERVSGVTETAGHGVQATVDGKTVLLGNAALLQSCGVDCGDDPGEETVVCVAVDGVFCGTIAVSDTVKDGAAEAMADLRTLGVKRCVMLTGDRRQAAETVAEQVGLDAVYAQLLPDDKVAQVERLLAEQGAGGKLAFVGDGLNDAPVLSRADVGVAMGSTGSDAAIEAADVVVMDDDLRKLPAAVRLARKTMRIVRENIIFALSVKAIILLLGALGAASMWMAVFGDVGVAILAILNAMRMLRHRGQKA
ncbi:MAG: cadmium-translocating P-type ATPase [Clostridia bacterium]|nr:cadmium-translocating P-type ATPase [Clostridia bacterium]